MRLAASSSSKRASISRNPIELYHADTPGCDSDRSVYRMDDPTDHPKGVANKMPNAQAPTLSSDSAFTAAFDRASKRDDAKKVSAKPEKATETPREDRRKATLGVHTKSVALARYQVRGETAERILCAGQAVPIWDMSPGGKCNHLEVDTKINVAALVMNNDDEMVIATGPSNLSYESAMADLGSESGDLEQMLGNDVGGLWTWTPCHEPVGGVCFPHSIAARGRRPASKVSATVGQALPTFRRFMPQLDRVGFIWLTPDESGAVEYFDVLKNNKRRFRELVIPLALELKGIPKDYTFRARQALSAKVGTSDIYLAVKSRDGRTHDWRASEQEFFDGDIPAAVVKITPWSGPESFYAEGLQKNSLAKAVAMLMLNKSGSLI